MAGEELPAVGETIGGYRLDRLIASGGMGSVFAATHAKLGRHAAVKVLDRQFVTDRDFVSRFLHEARIANEIRHPNIVEIYDFVEAGGRIALIMELLQGCTMAEALLRGRFSPVQALNICLQLCDAISAVHARGVVHRDLKPANLHLIQPLDSEFWDPPSFKILDFGIAKQNSAPVDHKTMQGALLGTPAYMAPEQIANEPVSAASDIYAIGELLYEMTSGRRLFDGENILVLTQKLKNQLPSFEMPGDVPRGSRIVALVKACVSPVPEQRPQMLELRQNLSFLLEEVEALEGTEDSAEWKPNDIEFDDGAQTVLAMEAVSKDMLAKAPLEQAIPNVPSNSTQMFFNRILEDIEEVKRPDPAPPPPPPVEAMPALLLMNEPTPAPSRQPSRLLHHPPMRSPSVVSSGERPAAVIVGTPLSRMPSTMRPIDRSPSRAAATPPQKKNRFLWLLMAPALLAIVVVAVPGVGDAAREMFDRMIGAKPNPIRRHLAAWKEIHGDVSGTAAERIQAAVAAHAQDSWPRYEAAQADLQRALILDPNNVDAIAFYVENELAWKEWLIFGAEAEQMVTFLEHARSLDPSHPAVMRADARKAEVLKNFAACRELARSVREKRPDPLAMMIEAECTLEQDPATAETLIWKASDQMAMDRAIRIGARARARDGRYAEALEGLEARLLKDPKNGRALLEAAAIDHLVGAHERELMRLRSATRADGDQLRAQLMLGRAQAELSKPGSAKSSLLSLSTNQNAPPAYRREAYVELAKLELAAGAPLESLELLEKGGELGADPALIAVKAESLLAAGKSQELLALIGQPRMTEENIPSLALLGGAQILNGRPDEAKHLFEMAVSLRPQDPRLFAFLAAARALLDDFGAARAALDKMLWLDLMEVLEDDRAPNLSRHVALPMVEHLDKMRDASGDPPCVDAISALLWFYAGDREQAKKVARKSSDSGKSPAIAMVLEGHLVFDADPVRAEELVVMLKQAAPSASSQLLVARLDASNKKESAREAYGKALSLNPELPLAKVERTAMELKRKKKDAIEELLALHVAYPHIGKLRRVLFRAGD